MVASLSTPQAALDARYTTPSLAVYIGGVLTPVVRYTGRHEAGRTATGRLTLPLPRPAHVEPWATVEVQGGHDDLTGTLFSGRLGTWEQSMTGRGDVLDIPLEGWSAVLAEGFRSDMVFNGPVSLDAVFVAVCQRAGIPSYIAEQATYPDGATPVRLGGNVNIDEGAVIIPANTSPLSWLRRQAGHYEYVVTDDPNGTVKLHYVNGTPTDEPVVTFSEGLHLGDTRRTPDYREIVNVWRIRGAGYEDELGGRVEIDSIAVPEEVEAHDEIPGGYRYADESITDLVRQDQADAVRENREIKYSEVYAPVRWDAVAVPHVNPGDVVAVESETVEASGNYWLLGMDVTSDDRGFVATYDGWAGAGTALPGIVNRETLPVQEGVWHGGDEYVSHYANEAPQGTSKEWNITIPERATAVNVRGYAHSWNSQTVAGDDTELNVSKWAIWLPGSDYDDDDQQPETSGTMPQMAERYYQRPNFKTFSTDSSKSLGDDGFVTDPGEWAPFAVNLGRLEAGDYVLRMVCGEKAGYDDGEIRAVFIEYFGSVDAAGYEEGAA